MRPRSVTAFRVLRVVTLVGLGLSWARIAFAQEPDPDLVKLGQSLLPTDDPTPAKKKPPAPRDAGGPATRNVDAPPDAGAAALDGSAAVNVVNDAGVDAGAERDASTLAAPREEDAAAASIDAGTPAPTATDKTAPKAPAPRRAPAGVGPAARQARIDSGENLEQKAAEESPLAKLGVPVQAVPAVATTATVGAMALWPFLVKTLTALAKAIFGAFLKTRAKKGKAIDKTQRTVQVMGFAVRPAELASVLVGALVYGLGVGYAFQGRALNGSFLLSQEALVVVIYYSRSFIRFGYERLYNLPTQFKFWPGGGLLCLASAYLGNTLGTVGYEVEETRTPEEAKRIVKMKAWLVALSLGMALAFFVANVVSPMKVLQSGRVMMSGLALAEILPFSPMPGKKIFDWNRAIWLLLVAAIVPSFVLVNFVL